MPLAALHLSSVVEEPWGPSIWYAISPYISRKCPDLKAYMNCKAYKFHFIYISTAMPISSDA